MTEAFFIAKENTMQNNRKSDRQTREIISEARQRAKARRDWQAADFLELVEAITENRRPRHNARRLVSFLEA
jgi:hypothetical protein